MNAGWKVVVLALGTATVLPSVILFSRITVESTGWVAWAAGSMMWSLMFFYIAFIVWIVLDGEVEFFR